MPLSGLAGCRARRRTAVLRTGPYRTTRTQGARAAEHHGLPRPSWALAAVLAVFQGGSLSGRGMCAALPPIAGKVACSRARRAIPQGSSRIRRAAESPARAGASSFSPVGGKMPQKLDGGKLSIPCASSARPRASMKVTQSLSTASSQACTSVTSIRRTPDSHLLT